MNTLRNHFIKASLISQEPVPPVPSLPEYYIQYTSTGGKIDPRYSNVFGSTIIGNYYDDYYNCYFITYDSPIMYIGDSAFSTRSSLTSITIPDGVTSIGERAFYICESLTSVVIPDSVTEIGGWAFCRCPSLTSITIPNGVTSIEQYTFNGCDSLSSVTIPNSVTSIGKGAFQYCESLASIVIPENVTNIGEWAFERCTSLTSITFNGTKAQWNAITKGTYWRKSVPATVIRCTDGKVTL